MVPRFAAGFPGAAAVVPLVAAAFGGFVVRFQRGALVAPFFVAGSPGTASVDSFFGGAIPGVASGFPG